MERNKQKHNQNIPKSQHKPPKIQHIKTPNKKYMSNPKKFKQYLRDSLLR